eukprot:TRINITY_DN35017_c0_g1_i1.p1 TRINITY_DN35017_c0_g1~~TRINITY_DN35017_c0_g1_i1.p1  ORF type:complete len:615 (-),score=117.57 TRINITY_DN35017_c0_g1_i1:148-1869(-)
MANVAPTSVSIAECHGTGTPLGDPIEVGALRGVMHDRSEMPLMLTSSKSNIGHAESAAGVNGLAKCVLMCLSSTAPPNVHLKSLNQHLDTEGFSCIFENECADVQRNSQHVGVSSFGFGGTNARADIWGVCQLGPRAARTPDLWRCEFVDISCPRCLGPMCWMCGVAVPEYSTGVVHRCSLLRNTGSYDCCSNCYTGGYWFGDVQSNEIGALDIGDRRLFVLGTWSGWSVAHEVEQIEKGVFVFSAALSETLVERFHFILDKDQGQLIYPSEDRAGMASRIAGPDAAGAGRSWFIDGRRDKKPMGTVYKMTLTWNFDTGEKRLEWEPTGVASPKTLDPNSYEHSYYIIGSWNGWDFERMVRLSSKHHLYEATLKIGVTGEEEFQLARDKDWGQVIHPSCTRAKEEWVLARGPDDGGHERHWLVEGIPGESVKVHLRITEGHIAITLNPGLKKEITWESGREAHSFFIMGTFSNWRFVKMIAEAGHGKAGLHRYRVNIGHRGMENFQIAIDEDRSRKLYPASTNANSGETVVEGPDGSDRGRQWLIRSRTKAVVEIVLDTTLSDRRKMVCWHEV